MRERVREFLGVWAPMILGLVLIGSAVSFILSPTPPSTSPYFVVDPLAYDVCGLLLVLIGAILVLSTFGRWRKARAARTPADDRQKNV
ncbi:MAG: hypothetical protein AABY30_02295 [Candidatus Thermoplasmatota archaeon]